MSIDDYKPAPERCSSCGMEATEDRSKIGVTITPDLESAIESLRLCGACLRGALFHAALEFRKSQLGLPKR